MLMRPLLALAALSMLAACAGMTPAGRNASRAPAPVAAPAPVIAAPAPIAQAAPAPIVAPAPTAQAAPAPVRQAAPAPTAQAAPPVASQARITPEPRPVSREDEDVVVQGQAERQTRPPEGDPRSATDRMRDIRAWDQCVSRAQAVFDTDPLRVQLDTPEETCRTALGMTNREAVPESRLR